MHPLSVAPRRDESRAPQHTEMAGDLRLRLSQHLYEEADTDLVLSDEVEQAQSRAIREGLEECLELGSGFHMRFDG